MPRALVSKLTLAALLLAGLTGAASLASAQNTTYTEVKSKETQLIDGGKAARFRIVIHPGNGPEVLVTDPVWTRTPSMREVAAAFPAIASTDRGSAVLRCAVSNIGSLVGCHTVSETPGGQGFSAAAQRKLIGGFRMTLPKEEQLLFNTLVVEIPFQFTRPGTPAVALTRFDWLATPSYDQISGALTRAGIASAGATATFSCAVGAQGDLGACLTREESRPGVGAALAGVAAQFKVGLWSEEGRPTVGNWISVGLSVG